MILAASTALLASCGDTPADDEVGGDWHTWRAWSFTTVNDDGNDVPVEVMQNVSGQLIETPRLMEALRTGQQQEAADLLEQGFDRGFFADCKPPHTK